MEGSVMKAEIWKTDLMLRIFDNSSKNVLFTQFFVDDCLLYRMKSKKSVWGAGGIAYHNGIITGRELVV